jgi:hypothetical protein
VTSDWKLALVEPGDGKSMSSFHLNGSLHCIAVPCEKFSSCGAVIYLHQPADIKQRADSKNLLYQYTKLEHSCPILSGSRMIRRILCKICTLNRLLYLLLSDANSSAYSWHTLVLNSMLCNCQLPNKHLWLYLHLLSKGMTLLLSETKRNFIAHCSFPCWHIVDIMLSRTSNSALHIASSNHLPFFHHHHSSWISPRRPHMYFLRCFSAPSSNTESCLPTLKYSSVI